MDRADLLGSWRLESAVLQRGGQDTDEPGFGDSPTGFIHYLPDGRMAALIAYGNQRPLPPDAASGDRPAEAGRFVAYGGTYSIEGDVVTHHVDISSNAAGNGLDFVRHVRLAGDTLHIRTPPTIPIGQPMTLVWKRVSAAQR